MGMILWVVSALSLVPFELSTLGVISGAALVAGGIFVIATSI